MLCLVLASGAAASHTGSIQMPDPKDDPKSSEWRPYIFTRDQWHCRICGDRFLYSEMVRKHIRSEEHTSELQSRENLVCRLLLEKKKKNNNSHDTIPSLLNDKVPSHSCN